MLWRPGRALSVSVAITLFFLTNVVFLVTAGAWKVHFRVRSDARTVQAMTTHKWPASRLGLSDAYFIGYTYVDGEGIEHCGSARVRADRQQFFQVGQPVLVITDGRGEGLSELQDTDSVPALDRLFRSWVMVLIMGVLAFLTWILLLGRLRVAWRTLIDRAKKDSSGGVAP